MNFFYNEKSQFADGVFNKIVYKYNFVSFGKKLFANCYDKY